ncbi:PIG-L family deacetylase [Candidatus Woesearchaeota archaeon]|nr:MAG: PIG-L family deacetylase [Candidatus Woesearchaeota archaeon]
MASILVICAHSDDQIFGPGGTLIKYANQGDTIHTVILSYGELSHFWLQSKVTAEMRIAESEHADKVIGGSGVTFLNLKEGKFAKEFKHKKVVQRLSDIIKEKKPDKIFTHSLDDPLRDHRETLKIVLETLDTIKYDVDVYTFNVWNIFNLKSNLPKLVVDISETFKTKRKALRCFQSQTMTMITLLWSVYAKAFFHGLQNNTKWAEVFYKIR